jgi:signal transduction histidine kinase
MTVVPGELGRLVNEYDWAKTPLGPIERWAQSLRTSLSICLASRFPIVMYWGPEYVVLYNDAYSAILGCKHPWALGQKCRDCWAEIWDTIGPMLDGVVASGQATWSDDLLLMLRRHSYPEECYFSFSFSPVRIETGGVGGVFTAVFETTDKVIGERRLRTLRDLAARAADARNESDAWSEVSKTLAENLHDLPFSVVCQVHLEQGQVRIRGSAGIDRDHPLCTLLCTPGSLLFDHVRHIAQSREILYLKNVESGLGDLPHGAWHVPPENVLLLPITDGGHETSSVLLAALSPHKTLDENYQTFVQLVARQIATSVTDARSHEDERRRAEALTEIDRAKTTFFSNVSHEFRTPLTLMLGPLQDLLADQTHLSPKVKERLELANRNGTRLLRLVNNLLDFSRIEAGRLQAVYQATDLATFTAELASVFRSATEQAGLKLIVDCHATKDLAYIDRDMWEKIVLNLISNAFKFTFEGEIAVSLAQVGHMAELRVSDTGVGIPAHEIPRLFDRFHRVPNTPSRTHEGSGIGLALVRELVKQLGGSIRVESTLRQGTMFIVNVPLRQNHLTSGQAGGTHPSTTTGTAPFVEEAFGCLPESERTTTPEFIHDYSLTRPEGSGIRSRVLIADDNADMRLYLSSLFSEWCDVKAVPNGRAALDVIREQRPDLVLTDVMMPELDGFGLLRELRANAETNTIPIILLSARAGEESRVEGLDAGADDYLVKPFGAREVIARVQTHLQLARVRNEANLEIHRLAETLESEVRARTKELERRNAEILQQSDQLRDLSGRLMLAQDEERRRIARDLHDSAGQNLAALGMTLAGLENYAKHDPERLSKSIKDAQDLIQDLTQEIRTTSYLLHPPTLDESGLSSAIRWYIDGLAERSGLSIELNIPDNLERFAPEIELAIFRLVQECLTNIHRHSGSKTAVICVAREPDKILVQVQDHGKGISQERLAEIQSEGVGVGIRGMQERVRQCHGELTVDSNALGAKIIAIFPAKTPAAKEQNAISRNSVA